MIKEAGPSAPEVGRQRSTTPNSRIIQPPSPSWGSILSAGRQHVERAWCLTGFPGIGLFALVVCVNLISDALRDQRSADR